MQLHYFDQPPSAVAIYACVGEPEIIRRAKGLASADPDIERFVSVYSEGRASESPVLRIAAFGASSDTMSAPTPEENSSATDIMLFDLRRAAQLNLVF